MTLKQTILSTIQIMFCRQRKKSFFVVSTSPIFVEFGVYIYIITQSHSHSEGLPQWLPKLKLTGFFLRKKIFVWRRGVKKMFPKTLILSFESDGHPLFHVKYTYITPFLRRSMRGLAV